MQIDITQPVRANSAADEQDVRQIKKALNRLGLYVPYAKIGITGITDAAMFDAIKAFQKQNGLPVTGAINPGDETLNALSRDISKTPDGQYIWRSVEDDKVRPGHAVLNHTVRDWDDAPDPGEDFNCRCWAERLTQENIIDDGPIAPVYPEALLIPLLRTPRAYGLLKLWLRRRNAKWVRGGHKSETRWTNQMKQRDWTKEQITQTIEFGQPHPAPNKVNPSNGATRYEYNSRFVVRDNKTKEILQISGEEFTPNK